MDAAPRVGLRQARAYGGRHARELARAAYVNLVRLAFDRRYGFTPDTARKVPLARVGREAPGRVHYEPSPWFVLARILPAREVGPDDVFVDFGAGMGRAVFQAAKRYQLRRVIGVELVPEFARAAQRNIDRNLHRLRCRDVAIVNSDALEYEIPDDLTIAYFANPFGGEIFAAVLDRLLASVDRRPRVLRIVYYNPVEHEQLMRTGRVRLVRRGRRLLRRWRPVDHLRLYEVDPGHVAS